MRRPALVALVLAVLSLVPAGGTPAGAAPPTSSWSKGASISSGDYLRAVSCVSSTFCAAGGDQGRVLVFDGRAWRTSVDLGPAGFGVTAVSCSSASSCVAGLNGPAPSYGGYAIRFDGKSWSEPVKVARSAPAAISCPSSRFCMAVGSPGDSGVYAVTLRGTTWSAPVTIDSRGRSVPTGSSMLSCTSASFCVATTWHSTSPRDHVVRFDGTSWTKPVPVAKGVPGAISCSSSRSCVNVLGDGRGNGYATRFNGTSWSAPRLVTSSAELSLVSCPVGQTFCIAIASELYVVGGTLRVNGPYTLVLEGSTWGRALKSPVAPGGMQALSCTAGRFCVGVIGSSAYVYR